MSKPPLSVTCPAVVNVALHGHSTITFRLPIKDSGSQPEVVRASYGPLAPVARLHPVPRSWHVSISPAQLHLRPGQTGYITVHVTGAGGGKAVVTYVEYRTAAAGIRAQARMSAGVASKVTFSQTGKITAVAPVQHPPAPASGNGPLVLGSVLLGLAAVVAIAGVGIRRWSIRRRYSPPRDGVVRPAAAGRHRG